MNKQKQVFSKTRYKVIPRVLVFAFNKEKVLLLKGSPNKKIWPNLYNGIGGHMEKGEHPLQAANREFIEETGLNLISPKLKAIITIETIDPNIGISMHVFSGKTSNGIPISSIEGKVEWIRLKDLSSLPLVEDINWLITQITSKDRQKYPIYAQYTYSDKNKLQIEFE